MSYCTRMLALALCAILCACTNDISVGDARGVDQLREEEELARVARELEGTWQGPLLGMRGELTFTPRFEPGTGDFVVNCPDLDECKRFAAVFNQPDDGGTSSVESVQLSGRFELVEKIGDALYLCVLTSSDGTQSKTSNLWLSPEDGELEFRLPGAASLAARLERQQ